MSLAPLEGFAAIQGIRAMGIHCGIKKQRPDLAIIQSTVPDTQAAAVFTKNAFAAAPVAISRQHVANGNIQAIVVNSGNANACTGRQGLRDALDMARETADHLGLQPEQVLVCSTGRIGDPLPIDKVLHGIQACADRLDEGTGPEVSQAILTTDTGPKEASAQFAVDGTTYTLSGIAKGAGMIHPNMATMLAFMITDAPIKAQSLRRALKTATERSFNQISIDGDESTNDTAILMANGAAGGTSIEPDSPGWEAFMQALIQVSQQLARQIAGDGEGATKLLTVDVRGAASDTQARTAARAIARSNLVKAAVHGEDPNWGRIVAALGGTECQVDPDTISLFIGNPRDTIAVLKDGEPLPDVEAKARALLGGPETYLRIDLEQGDGRGTAWGCDLTTEYVTFNSAYTT